MRAVRLFLASAAAGLTVTACAYNEDLGRNQFLLVDDSALASAAQEAWTQTLRTSRVSTDRAANERVRRVASRLVQAAGLGNRSWEYVVFDNAEANAFVMPGGKVGVNTGLLRMVENDDQLAAVIGHEIGHSVANHAAERYSQTAATQVALAGAQGLAGDREGLAQGIASYGGIGAQLGLLLPFSRRHELEADRLGVQYMARAGFRPAEALTLWRRMAAARQGATPEFMSTHPSDASRIAALEQILRQQGMV